MFETKLSKLKRYMEIKDYRAALKLAASWGKRRLGGGAHAEAITVAWSAYSNPNFYVATGKDPLALIEAGLVAIRERYGI